LNEKEKRGGGEVTATVIAGFASRGERGEFRVGGKNRTTSGKNRVLFSERGEGGEW